MTFFHQHFCSLIYNDDDLTLHDLSADSTTTSPLLCDTAYLSVTQSLSPRRPITGRRGTRQS